jgi:uncharacterized membrane protein
MPCIDGMKQGVRAMSQTAVQTESPAGAADVEAGKLPATLSYVVPFYLILPLMKRDNAFSGFHARQALVLWIAAVATSIAITLIMMLVPVALIARLLSLAFSVAVIGLAVIGALNAWNGRQRALPVIGARGEALLSNALKK